MDYVFIGFCFVAGIVCVLMWLRSGKRKPVRVLNSATVHEAEIVNDDEITKNLMIPPEWDEQFIREQVNRAHGQGSLIGTYFKGLKERFILGVEAKTARSRVAFINSLIEQLNLRTKFYTAQKESLSARDGLELHDIERQIRVLELNAQREDLEKKRKSQEELAELELERDKLKLKVEMTKLNKEIDELNTPQRETNAADAKKRKRDEIWEKMAKRKSEVEQKIAELTQGKPIDECPEDVQNQVERLNNMHEAAVEHDMEEMGKLW